MICHSIFLSVAASVAAAALVLAIDRVKEIEGKQRPIVANEELNTLTRKVNELEVANIQAKNALATLLNGTLGETF